MGEAARRAYMRRTTPSQRFDAGIELSESMIASILRRAGIPTDATDEETLQKARRILREAGG